MLVAKRCILNFRQKMFELRASSIRARARSCFSSDRHGLWKERVAASALECLQSLVYVRCGECLAETRCPGFGFAATFSEEKKTAVVSDAMRFDGKTTRVLSGFRFFWSSFLFYFFNVQIFTGLELRFFWVFCFVNFFGPSFSKIRNRFRL